MSMHFSFNDGRAGATNSPTDRPQPERPFRILAIADFSGRQSRGINEPLDARKAHRADIDTLDKLPGKLDTIARLPARGGVELPIRTLDDLHPDSIYDHSPLFAALRDLRTRARDHAQYQHVADEVSGWAGEHGPPASQIEPKPAGIGTPESEFATLLAGSVNRAPRPAATIDTLLRQIVAPHIVPDRTPAQSELIDMLEKATADEMRAVLRDPDWRRTESAWRSLHTLVTGLELDETLELHILDASADELASSADQLEHTLVTGPAETAGGAPWALVLHLERHTPATLDALAPLAHLVKRAGAILASGVAPQSIGIDSVAPTPSLAPEPNDWDEPADAYASLARSPDADAVCLACPGILLRIPYGERTDPIDRFEFEELKADPTNHDLLWAPGALGVALLLGNAFSHAGWSLDPSGGGTLDDLPVIPTDNGESMHPCAQAWISDRAADALQKRGVTPLRSVQHRGAVQIGPLQSITGVPLTHRWH